MACRSRKGAGWGLVVATLVHVLPAAAQAPPAPPAATDAKAEAIAHFDRGLALYDAGAWAAALAEFVESRRRYPLHNALYQAGLCFEKLQRYDEALEQYETLLRELDATTSPKVRENVQRRVVAMRSLVGEIAIAEAEPGARVTVDGIARGEHPLLAPLRVASGEHLVRVWKAGFEPFEERVVVAGGKTETVVARLRALGPSGEVRVREQSGKSVAVLVDGADVGAAPWQGALAPGMHVVALRGEGRVGTPPVQVTVVRDRMTLLTLAAEELAATLHVDPVPLDASLAIDGVSVGHGVWEGRLRPGLHRVEASAEGFLAAVEQVEVGHGERRTLRIELARDPRSAFAPRRGHFAIEAAFGPSLVPVAGGDVASGCSGSCDASFGLGGLGLVRLGYELGSGFGFGLTAGYLAAAQRFHGRPSSVQLVGLGSQAIALEESVWLRTGIVGGWVGFALGGPHPARFRLGGGALLGTASDERSGALASGTLEPTGELRAVRGGYLAPELRLGVRASRAVELSLGIEVLVGIVPSPPRWLTSHPVVIERPSGVRDLGTFPSDSFAGTTVAIVPSLGVRYEL